MLHRCAQMRTRASNCMSQAHQKYHVMMILTDGAIMDMGQTVDEIVCSCCVLSSYLRTV